MDLMILVAVIWVVASILLGIGHATRDRELVLQAQACWHKDQRAVYIQVDDEYRIECRD